MKKILLLILLIIGLGAIALNLFSHRPPKKITIQIDPEEIDYTYPKTIEESSLDKKEKNENPIPQKENDYLEKEREHEEFMRSEEAWGIEHDRQEKYLKEIVECEVKKEVLSFCSNYRELESFLIDLENQKINTPPDGLIDGCIIERRYCADPQTGFFLKEKKEEKNETSEDHKSEAYLYSLENSEIVECEVQAKALGNCSNLEELRKTIEIQNGGPILNEQLNTLVEGCITLRKNCLNPSEATSLYQEKKEIPEELKKIYDFQN